MVIIGGLGFGVVGVMDMGLMYIVNRQNKRN